ncbi:7TM-DISM domain-containing protein [Runella sp. SP2]|uniref:7TMR-DISMED2 domain-containing protein n=1 Tax=Runella sp. SP2 TaxID=2268026 RepID=UPI000F08ABCF|nr:7TM-DISM domain-containing protein [Runella sp. SP2]AYQ31879.1 hypothetical protein DTQ70_06685 [Runella sp. SP2]
MRLLLFFLFFGVWTPLWGQQVLTITNAQKANPIAPYTYVFKDKTKQLPYEEIAHFPLDFFQRLNQQEIVQFGYFYDKIWLRFEVKNKTKEDLYLIHSYRGFRRMEVIIIDENGQKRAYQSGESLPALYQQIQIKPPVFPIGHKPSTVYLSVVTENAHGDFIHIGNLDQALSYQRFNTVWQSFSMGIYVLVFIYAFIFAIRLRDALIGWYALLMLSILFFYVDYYSFFPINKYVNHDYQHVCTLQYSVAALSSLQ